MQLVLYIVTVIVFSLICYLSYFLGYKNGAQRILSEWKDWLNNPNEE